MKRLSVLALVAASLALGVATRPLTSNHSISRTELADRYHQHFRTQRFFNRASGHKGASQIVPRAPYTDPIDQGSRTPSRWRRAAG